MKQKAFKYKDCIDGVRQSDFEEYVIEEYMKINPSDETFANTSFEKKLNYVLKHYKINE